ncbi:hypothetical protein TCDM_05146 [Trypanosoma cruzi Dm28c]|uniref:Uncharacterized protein n=2 Tax=Trypanosoma cruzi TaxID=5693 RepID=V5DFP8_TRYCR|nr:hypothetical protein TCDM_05146 [Trypanosoma cruzi Dm28c]PBJ71467.1 hypothetical protein BCY84_16810 [Trypanosoma cruzi cruzi]PWU94680.1 hypothetical protein C4B63_25g229 [Trypanosoma cruzi]
MSRRSQWESMRQEARNRVQNMDATPILENTPGSSNLPNTPGGSGERTRVKSRHSGRLEGRGASLHQHEGSGQEKDGDAMRTKAGAEEGVEGADHENAVCRLYNAENAAFSLVPILDPHATRPLGNSISADTAAANSSVVSNPPSWNVLDEGHGVPKAGSAAFFEETVRELSTAGSENGVATLQLELAREKRKNIFVEQRLVSLEEEVKVLRAENMRLASITAGDAAATRRDSAAGIPRGEELLRYDVPRGGPMHMEHLVTELKEELDLLKEYTRELEERLAERSNALERRSREVEQKESRIRQLERIMADEMIRRSKLESAEEGTGGTIHAPTTTTTTIAPAADKHHFYTSKSNTEKGNNEGGSGKNHEPNSRMREKPISKVEAPSVVYRVTSLTRARSETEHPPGGAGSEPLAQKNRASVPQETTPSSLSLKQEKSSKSDLSLSPHNPRKSGPSKTKNSSALEHIRSHVFLQNEEQQNHHHYHRSGVSSVNATPRRASLITRKTGASVAIPSVKTSSRRGGKEMSAPSSARQGSATRRKSVSKNVNRDRQSTPKRNNTSSISNAQYADESTQRDSNPALLLASRRSVSRPPPLENSTISTSVMNLNTTTLQHMDTRSVASTVRSRPRIIHEDSGNVVIQASTTTVVTRSAKKLESLIPQPQPRADAVEPVPSDHPFVSEKFSTTTYRPNRLLRYHKDDSNTRSLTPPPL